MMRPKESEDKMTSYKDSKDEGKAAKTNVRTHASEPRSTGKPFQRGKHRKKKGASGTVFFGNQEILEIAYR